MSWRADGAWRPVLHLDRPSDPAQVIGVLDGQLRRMLGHQTWSIGPDLSVTSDAFRRYALLAALQAHQSGDRTWGDFAVAFGCEVTVTEGSLIQDTALRTMNGAGHQHFVQFMQLIAERTKLEHLEKTLFRPWRYDDPVDKQTLRWDPADDVRRAFRWRDPSGDPQRRRRGGMLGANRLAIEGLPLIPTIPTGPNLHTTGFSPPGGKTRWTWPIWSKPIEVDLVRSLLSLPDLGGLPESGRLRSLDKLGIVEVFRSRRLSVDKFRSFTPALPL